MKSEIDPRNVRAHVEVGFSSFGPQHVAKVSLYDGDVAVLVGDFDYPSYWSWSRCLDHVAQMLEASCQLELPGMEQYHQVWQVASEHIV
jgi:uncharacterized metal-binding protein YceD (DUF177 family)